MNRSERSVESDSPRGGAGRRRRRTGKRGIIFSIVAGSVLVHIIALVLFGLLKIAEFFKEPEATFIVEKKIVIPAQTREHKMNMAKHAAMTPKPSFDQKLVSTRPMDFALPDLPEVPIDQMIPLDPAELVSDQVNNMVGSAGLGAALGRGLAGGGGTGGGLSFFDIKDEARSVVIMIDVSASMFGRTGDLDYDSGKLLRRGKDQAFQAVREEAFKLIDGLSVNSLFGIIHWSGSARTWKEQLVPATRGHKEEAKAHIQNQVDHNKAGPTGGRPGGTRHDYALEALFQLAPETAFMLTDGNATRSQGRGQFEVIDRREIREQISEAREAHPTLPRIHTIYYLTGKDQKDEERLLRDIASDTGGKFRKVKAAANPGGQN